MKKLAVLVCAALFLLASCQAVPGEFPEGIMGEKEIARLEKLYGQDFDTAVKDLGFSPEDAYFPMGDGYACNLKQTRRIAGEDFHIGTRFSKPQEDFFWIAFRFHLAEDELDRAWEIVEEIYEAAGGAYGEPFVYYEGMGNRLSEKLAGTNRYLLTGYKETWRAGENTDCTLDIAPVTAVEEDGAAEKQVISIGLTYQRTE